MKDEVIFPQWLGQTEQIELPTYKKTWLRADYLEKTLADIQKMMIEDEAAVHIIAYRGLLQRVEPRIKLIGIAALILSTALTKSMGFLVVVNLLIALLAVQSGIAVKSYLARVGGPVLFFVGLTMLPGMLSWITPGAPLYTIYAGPPLKIGWFIMPGNLTITLQGVKSAVFVMLRAAASLGLVVLLIKTTRWTLLTRAMGSVGLPSIVVTVLDLTYRYIFLFLLLLTEYLMGRSSRLVGVESQRAKLLWIGGAISGFLRMVWDYGQEINNAMLSRGYSGESAPEPTVRLQSIDVCFLIAVAFICLSGWGGNLGVYINI